jgi:hypothetical protein
VEKMGKSKLGEESEQDGQIVGSPGLSWLCPFCRNVIWKRNRGTNFKHAGIAKSKLELSHCFLFIFCYSWVR